MVTKWNEMRILPRAETLITVPEAKEMGSARAELKRNSDARNRCIRAVTTWASVVVLPAATIGASPTGAYVPYYANGGCNISAHTRVDGKAKRCSNGAVHIYEKRVNVVPL